MSRQKDESQAIKFVDWINGGGHDGKLTSFKGLWSISGAKEQDWITTKELYQVFMIAELDRRTTEYENGEAEVLSLDQLDAAVRKILPYIVKLLSLEVHCICSNKECESKTIIEGIPLPKCRHCDSDLIELERKSKLFVCKNTSENEVIGIVSSAAKWIKEQDTFTEDEIQVSKICKDDSCAPYDSYCRHCCSSSGCSNNEGNMVLIKGPMCECFH